MGWGRDPPSWLVCQHSHILAKEAVDFKSCLEKSDALPPRPSVPAVVRAGQTWSTAKDLQYAGLRIEYHDTAGEIPSASRRLILCRQDVLAEWPAAKELQYAGLLPDRIHAILPVLLCAACGSRQCAARGRHIPYARVGLRPVQVVVQACM